MALKQKVFEGSPKPEVASGGKPQERGTTRAKQKEQIIAAAQGVFSEKGFHYARMEEIASSAGVSAGTLYNYFGSKEELYITVVDGIFTGLFTAMNDVVLRSGVPFSKKLGDVIFQSCTAADATRKFSRLVHSQISFMTSELIGSFHNKGEMWFRQFLDLYSTLMFYGIKEGVLRDLDPKDHARLFLGIWQGFFQEWLMSPVEYRLADKAALFEEFFLHGAGAGESRTAGGK